MTASNLVTPDSTFSHKSHSPNALKHGLTATRYVSPERAERIRAIRAELEAIHMPRSAEEADVVEQLSIARARLYDAEAAHDDRVRWERCSAVELFDRRQRDRFLADREAWRDDPFSMTLIFGATFLSAAWLSELWASVIDGLNNDCGVTYEQARDLLAAEGGCWRAGKIDARAGRLMGMFLALHTDPEPVLQRWVADSREGQPHPAPLEDDLERARWFLETAPEPPGALAELVAKANAQCELWTRRANDLRPNYETGRNLAAGMAMGLGAADADTSRECRLALRYLITEKNRVEKLERRLETLKKMRPLNALRAKPSAPSSTAPPSPSEPVRSESASAGSDQVKLTQTNVMIDDTSALRNEVTTVVSLPPNANRLKRRTDPQEVIRTYRQITRKRQPHEPKASAPADVKSSDQCPV